MHIHLIDIEGSGGDAKLLKVVAAGAVVLALILLRTGTGFTIVVTIRKSVLSMRSCSARMGFAFAVFASLQLSPPEAASMFRMRRGNASPLISCLQLS